MHSAPRVGVAPPATRVRPQCLLSLHIPPLLSLCSALRLFQRILRIAPKVRVSPRVARRSLRPVPALPRSELCLHDNRCRHGFCVAPFTCNCDRNWGGILCDHNLDVCASASHLCLNGGQCVNTAPDAYRCHCPDGFSGLHCQTIVDACALRPCLHSGLCHAQNASHFHCSCAPGFSGERCERDVDECASNPCANGGTCHNLRNAFRCQCVSGWRGERCEEDINECEDVSACVRAVRCQNTEGSFHCECEEGGVRVANCVLIVGFEGKHCETERDDCQHVTCHNGGQCLDLRLDFRCVCEPPFGGRFCRQMSPTACVESAEQMWTFNVSSECRKVCVCEQDL
ncbi:unnamed protein product, partial [Medioppia subpectinata]